MSFEPALCSIISMESSLVSLEWNCCSRKLTLTLFSCLPLDMSSLSRFILLPLSTWTVLVSQHLRFVFLDSEATLTWLCLLLGTQRNRCNSTSSSDLNTMKDSSYTQERSKPWRETSLHSYSTRDLLSSGNLYISLSLSFSKDNLTLCVSLLMVCLLRSEKPCDLFTSLPGDTIRPKWVDREWDWPATVSKGFLSRNENQGCWK